MYTCLHMYVATYLLLQICLKTAWPSFSVRVDEVCAISVQLQLTRRIRPSTCLLSSSEPYLVSSSGREISRYARKQNRYKFTGLSPNTRHSIHVLFRLNTPEYHRVLVRHATTRASRCKFPKYSYIANTVGPPLSEHPIAKVCSDK